MSEGRGQTTRTIERRSCLRRRCRWLSIHLCAALVGAAVCATLGRAESGPGTDWPGLWGPQRSARVEGALPAGPDLDVREVWRRPLGSGYAEVAVAGNRGYTLYTDGESDFLVSLDTANGKEVWRARLDATYRGHDGSDDGPISTPLVSQGRILALNPFGKLFAFDTGGKELWKRDLVAELGAVPPYYGFATVPLAVGQRLIVQAGGEKENNLVALDPATGRTLWSSQPSTRHGYSSPVAATLAGVPQVVARTKDKLFGADPETGKVLWSHPSVGDWESMQAPMLLPGDRVLMTSWVESAVVQVTAEGGAFKVSEVWRKPVLKGTYSPTVFHQGHLYGMNAAYLTCLDAATGELKWREKVYHATLILVGGDLVLLGERSGHLHVVAATPEGFRERLKVRVFNPGARAATGPVFAGGRFYLRNVEEVVALEIFARPAPPAGQKGAGS